MTLQEEYKEKLEVVDNSTKDSSVILSSTSNSKLCECGCGQSTSIAKYNHKTWGYLKGQSRRFIQGHHKRKRLVFKEPEKAEQILLGSLLGDGSIIEGTSQSSKHKQYSYSEAHSLKQKEYLLWKNNYLNYNTRLYTNNKKYFAISINKGCTLLFKKYRELFYPNNKKVVTREILDKLEPLGLAVWYMDDGSYNYWWDIINLCTQSFNLEEHKIIQKWFKEKWGINCRIGKSRSNYIIVINKTNSKKFIELIKDYIHPLLVYKIGLDEEKIKKSKEKIKKYFRDYNLNNKEQIKLQKRAYYKIYSIKNKYKIQKNRREYYLMNREKEIKNTHLWREKNPNYTKEYYQNNKNKKREYRKRWILKNLYYSKNYYINNRSEILQRSKERYKKKKLLLQN